MAKDPRKLLGQRVRALRQALRISQEELADRAGVHRTYLGGVERGERNPALKNITRIASALGVQPAELFATGSRRSASPRVAENVPAGSYASTRRVSPPRARTGRKSS